MANGWLSPDGILLEVAIGKHYLAIEHIMQELDSDIEQWMHVTPSSCWVDLYPTEAQILWVRNSGRNAYIKDLELMLELKNDSD